jgi:cell fate regulator YaaT (PSP1 superfamily)
MDQKLRFTTQQMIRIDFRALIKDFAKRIWHAQIEMKQVGFRQEARLGGIGFLVELCCSYLADRF